MNPQAQPGIKITQILLVEADFSHREDFLERPHTEKVELQVQFSFSFGIDPDKQIAISRLGVTTGNSKQLYSFSFQIAALLEVDSEAPNFPLEDYVKVNAWTTLFPFLRETVANVTGRGRFGAVWLSPLNIPAVLSDAVVNSEGIGKQLADPNH